VQSYCAPAAEEVKEFNASPNRQKPIDLYDLMDVELRMIRQKNLDMDFANSAAKEDINGGVEKFVTIEEDEVVPNQRSKAFSHIESVMKDNLNAISLSQISGPVETDRSSLP
jgi:hypothetical protein